MVNQQLKVQGKLLLNKQICIFKFYYFFYYNIISVFINYDYSDAML